MSPRPMFYCSHKVKRTTIVKPRKQTKYKQIYYYYCIQSKVCKEMTIAMTLNLLTWLESTFRIDAFN